MAELTEFAMRRSLGTTMDWKKNEEETITGNVIACDLIIDEEKWKIRYLLLQPNGNRVLTHAIQLKEGVIAVPS